MKIGQRGTDMGRRALFLALSFISFACWADGSSTADDVRSSCLSRELEACIMSQPNVVTTVQPGVNHSSPVCLSDAKKQEFSVTCDHDVKEYCDSFAMLANVNPPEGCPGHQNVAAEPDRPGVIKTIEREQTTPAQTHPPQEPSTPSTPPQPTPQGPDIASAQADLQTCQQSADTANNCCNDPQSCGAIDNSQAQSDLSNQAQAAFQNGDSQGLNSICSQLSQVNQNAANSDNGSAGVCMTKHTACENICQQLWSKWNQQAQQCSGDGCDQLSAIVSNLSQSQSSCASLQSTEATYRQQALASANQTGAGSYCSQTVGTQASQNDQNQPPNPFNQNQGGLQPSSANANPAQNSAAASTDPYNASSIRQTLNCDAHPEFPSCYQGEAIPDSQEAESATDQSSRAAANTFVPPQGGRDTTMIGGARNHNMRAMNAGSMAASGSSGWGKASGSVSNLASNRRVKTKSAGFNTDVLHGEGAHTGFEGYDQAARRASSGFKPNGALPRNPASDDDLSAKWKGFSLLPYLGSWGKKSIQSLVSLFNELEVESSQVNHERLGYDSNISLNETDSPKAKNSSWKGTLIDLFAEIIALSGVVYFFGVKNKPFLPLDRRKLERRAVERRTAPSQPREASLERRKVESPDRRTHEQRTVERRIQDKKDRRIGASSNDEPTVTVFRQKRKA